MSVKERIRELYLDGLNPLEIEARVNAPTAYVYKYLREWVRDGTIGPPLNVPNYVKAVQRGCKTRQDLARHFHVRREAICEFEDKSGVLQLLTSYLYMNGKEPSEIGQKLHIRRKSIQIPPNAPTLDKVRRDLAAILDIFAQIAVCGDAETMQYNELKKLHDKLQNLSDSLGA